MAETASALRSKAVSLAVPNLSIAKRTPVKRVGAMPSSDPECSHLGKLQYASDFQKEIHFFLQVKKRERNHNDTYKLYGNAITS